MRVVAVSAETSLAAALNMMDGWEVVFAREGEDVGEVAAGAAVVLAGGGTTHGLELVADLRSKGMNIPAVVLGDSPPPVGAESTVLSPPFTLDELRAAVEGAVRSGRRAREEASAEAAALASAEAEAKERAEQQERAEAEAQAQARAEAEKQARAEAHAAAEERDRREAAAAAARAEAAAAEAARKAASAGESAYGAEAPTATPGVPPSDHAAPPERGSATPAGQPGSFQTPAPAAVEGNGSGATPSATPTIEPPAALQPPPATGAPTTPPSSVAGQLAPPEPPRAEPARPAPPPVPEERGKRRKRRRDRDDEAPAIAKAPVAPAGSVDARLRLAEQAARAIEDVLVDMPFLSDLESLSEAVVGEIVAAFSPEIVALYLPSGDGYWVAGGYQLTPAEKRLNVKPDHPLFRELLATGEPILIAPLDLARAMVSGIAGARTEAMIAGPVQASSGCVGVIIVGRDDFDDKDLDTLAGLAAEAASGLAVGQAIDRLRSRRR